MSIKKREVALCAMMVSVCGATGWASSISVSLVNPGPSAVLPGTPVTLEVLATFDTRLSAIAFDLAASGSGGAVMTARSLAPTGPNGLTYVSRTMQDPFEDNLPHDLKAASITEVAYDADYGPAPGSASDGLPPGSGVLIEQITVVPSGSGSIIVSLSNVSAAHTTSSPDGTLFNVSGVGMVSVQINLTEHGDADGDGDIDIDDYQTFPACMTGPNAGPAAGGCEVFDFDIDADIDLDDFAGFQSAFTG